ncbi:MAG: hypothetical protein LJE69_01705 [Thiohalocapsa sp.]|jgi:hypothetical protein|uniref:hypothetical protein n=1 Tax=Thiohalocapsa sp. TaxID=2497641 RepID=UPI0025D04DFE|nr:hypothetical protein [Thiohalocapsa sp.]MCG6939951.1 hypothetical protein [Thiohalocapsa sp.]
MFVFDAAALLQQPQTPAPRQRRHLPARLLRAIGERQRLLRWHRARPRPAGCGWVPRRVWARHSALLCLRAGIEPSIPVERGLQ